MSLSEVAVQAEQLFTLGFKAVPGQRRRQALTTHTLAQTSLVEHKIVAELLLLLPLNYQRLLPVLQPRHTEALLQVHAREQF